MALYLAIFTSSNHKNLFADALSKRRSEEMSKVPRKSYILNDSMASVFLKILKTFFEAIYFAEFLLTTVSEHCLGMLLHLKVCLECCFYASRRPMNLNFQEVVISFEILNKKKNY